MNQLVTEARALCEGATKGPWETLLSAGKEYWIKTPRYGVRDFCCLTGGLEHEADAALIARSRTLLPEMAAEIERLERERDRFKARLEAAEKDLENLIKIGPAGCGLCKNGRCWRRNGTEECNPEWRGLCSENSAEALDAMKEDEHG